MTQAATPAPVVNPLDDKIGMHFNRSVVACAAALPAPTELDVRTERAFWALDYDSAIRKCGDVTRLVLERAPIRWDRHRVFVTCKVQYLEPGGYPTNRNAMLWHVDVPISLTGSLAAALGATQVLDLHGREAFRSSRIHLYHTSAFCRTAALVQRDVVLPSGKCVRDFEALHAEVEYGIRVGTLMQTAMVENVVHSTDEWELHRATAAERPHWRLWVRIVEMDAATVPSKDHPNTTYYAAAR